MRNRRADFHTLAWRIATTFRRPNYILNDGGCSSAKASQGIEKIVKNCVLSTNQSATPAQPVARRRSLLLLHIHTGECVLPFDLQDGRIVASLVERDGEQFQSG